MSGRSARELYVECDAHREGDDLEQIVVWAAGARTALDVATGGGHVARRLREAGLEVVTTDPRARDEPGRDLPGRGPAVRRRELRRRRLPDRRAPLRRRPAAAVREMARVSADRVLLVDTMNMGDAVEEAEKLRDPSHVRNYTEAEWRELIERRRARGRRASGSSHTRSTSPPGSTRTGCEGDEAARVVELLGDRARDGRLTLDKIAIMARSRR